jgi:hypothetical protein
MPCFVLFILIQIFICCGGKREQFPRFEDTDSSDESDSSDETDNDNPIIILNPNNPEEHIEHVEPNLITDTNEGPNIVEDDEEINNLQVHENIIDYGLSPIEFIRGLIAVNLMYRQELENLNLIIIPENEDPADYIMNVNDYWSTRAVNNHHGNVHENPPISNSVNVSEAQNSNDD